MFKNIFQRMFFTYLAITVLSVTTLALLLNAFINDYHLKQKQQELLAQGAAINALYNNPQYANQPVLIQQTVDLLSKTTGSKIYILRLSPAAVKEALNLESIKNDHLAKDLPKIMSGETIMKKRQFSGRLKMDVVYVGAPLEIRQQISGAVLLFSPFNEVEKIVQPIYKIVWTSALVFVLVAAFLIHMVSRRISSPIMQMSQAAEEIAAGNYERTIEVTGADEISRLANSFLYMRRRIQQTERMRQELLANVSHELRTPLTSIRGFIQAILDGVVAPSDQRRYLKLSYQEAGRLAKLTGDLLDLAKLQTGNLQLHKTQINLRDWLEEICDSFALACEQKNILLKKDFSQNLYMQVDADRFAQVIINLLHNALKFTSPGGSISLVTRQQEKKVILQITDTGIGMAEEELSSIFDHFYKVDKSRDANQGGSGIGLYVAKQIVQLHGGTITAASQVGQGTSFTIEL